MFEEIKKHLLEFQKPGRYIGSELGIPKKDFTNSEVRFVISYPDVYEVGMSNLGIKIIYDRINRFDYASCERVFSPWVDFEEFLNENNYPLYSLESKTPINQFDFIGISIQYELLFSNFLNILKLGHISILASERNNDEPIVICGGPAVTNPAPFSPFVDLFFIGEGEDAVGELISMYYSLKNNKSRLDIIQKLSEIPGVYSPKFSKNVVKRQVYRGFSEDKGMNTYLIPNIDIVQDKLVVEIMRGCPNKCRFCQAGFIYKPHREKSIDLILDIVENGTSKLGINKVTLSSLSSGDYSEIITLTELFNKKFSSRHISFSLPSIRVETFDLDLLEKINSVRKSGLTFAIESPTKEGQLSINKLVLTDKITQIIEYASDNGWRLVKFYFMIGLPNIKNEKDDIITLIDYILSRNKKLKININIAVFVPKAHSPFQYEKQMGFEESVVALKELEHYYYKSRVRIKKHDPYESFLEGIIARGDSEVGMAFYEAFKNGAKFDGWSEFFDFEIYKEAFDKLSFDYNKYLDSRSPDDKMPWDVIDIGLSKAFYTEEIRKSKEHILSDNCKNECDANCYICRDGVRKAEQKKLAKKVLKSFDKMESEPEPSQEKIRYFLEFSKRGLLTFIGHIDIIKYFEKLFLRSKVPILFTNGYNPHARLQFSSALSLGVESECEILEFFTTKDYDENELLSILRDFQHDDIPINRVRKIDSNTKYSLFENIAYYVYSFGFKENDYKTVKELYDFFESTDLEYEFKRKGKITRGRYQDYIEFLEISDNKIIAKINMISPMPKILDTAKDIFGKIDVDVKKEKVYGVLDDKEVELFDLI